MPDIFLPVTQNPGSNQMPYWCLGLVRARFLRAQKKVDIIACHYCVLITFIRDLNALVDIVIV